MSDLQKLAQQKDGYKIIAQPDGRIEILETETYKRAKEEREVWSSGYDAALVSNAILYVEGKVDASVVAIADEKLAAYRKRFGGAE